MIKEALIALLLWVDPGVQVVQASLVCPPLESPQAVERADERAARGMDDMGKRQPGKVVDPYGVLSKGQRDALEHGPQRSGGN